jgi:hypothetical protein
MMARLARGGEIRAREQDPATRNRHETCWMSVQHADDQACDAHQREPVAAAEIDAHAGARALAKRRLRT